MAETLSESSDDGRASVPGEPKHPCFQLPRGLRRRTSLRIITENNGRDDSLETVTSDPSDGSSTGSWEAVPTPTATSSSQVPAIVEVDEHEKVFPCRRWLPGPEHFDEFIAAVAEGNIKAAQAKADKGFIHIDRKTNDGRTPLFISMQHNHLEMMKWLLDQDANVYRSVHGIPPIVHAVLKTDCAPQFIQLLMDYDASLTCFVDRERMNALHWASARGGVEAVDFLLNKGMDVESLCSKGRTPLMMAAENGQLLISKVLLAKGADLYKRSDNGGTALTWAACNGHLEVVKYLLMQGIEVDDYDESHLTPLAMASNSGHLDTVNYLIAQGANVNSESIEPRGFTPAMAAAAGGHAEVLRSLISNGADLTVRNEFELTPLEVSLAAGQRRTIRVLLEALGGPEYPTKSAALQIATSNSYDLTRSLMITVSLLYREVCHENSERGSKTWMKWVLDLGGDLIKPKAMVNMMHAAIQDGRCDTVEGLLRLGADPNRYLPSGHTPLGLAVKHHDFDIVEALLKAGADPAKPNVGEVPNITPLHKALLAFELDREKDTSIIDLLLATGRCKIMKGSCAGATAFSYILHQFDDARESSVAEIIAFRMLESIQDVNEDCSDDGWTLLHVAAERGRMDLIDILLQKGANINVKDRSGEPLFLWTCCNAPKLARGLLERGADPFTRNQVGQTGLHIAAAIGDVELLNILLKRQLDINAVDENNSSPLISAIMNSTEEAALFLLDHSPKINIMTLDTKRTALHHAANLNSRTTPMHRVVENLLAHPETRINAQDHHGQTPLALICRSGSKPLVQSFLPPGADPEISSHTYTRPLTIALTRQNEDAALALIEHGVDVTTPEKEQRTPLHLAVEYNNVHATRRLLEKGVNVDVVDDEGRTPLCTCFHPLTAQLLIDHGADVNRADEKAWTPVHHALANGSGEGFEVLVKAGADVSAKTLEGVSVRDMAEEMKRGFWDGWYVDVLDGFEREQRRGVEVEIEGFEVI